MENFTNECVQCGREFTPANPCCCDDACSDQQSQTGQPDGVWRHKNGSCWECCPSNKMLPHKGEPTNNDAI